MSPEEIDNQPISDNNENSDDRLTKWSLEADMTRLFR